jgi:foldase protein PrsA
VRALADISVISPRRDLVSWPRRRRAVLVAVAMLIVGSALIAGACGASSPGSAGPTADPIVAMVDGQPIHRSQVTALVGEARLTNQEITEKDALDGVIDEELLRQEAGRLGVTPPASLVEARFGALERQVGDAAALDKALKGVGLTRAQLRERLSVVVLGERVAAAEFPKLQVTRREAEAYYRRHLFVFTTPAAVKLGDISVRTEQMARGAIQSIRDGESFSETAKTFNRDPELKRTAGQLGWVTTDTLPTTVAKAIAKLRPGQISEPVQSLGSFNVLKLYARRAARTIPFARVESEVRAAALSQRRAAALRRWLDRARAKAEIEILP